MALDADRKMISDDKGNQYRYEKLLLAMGGTPRTLPIPGGDLDGIVYYRYLDDYKRVRQGVDACQSVLIVGGGFIGSELGASLARNDAMVTMIFPEEYLCARVLPDYLARSVQQKYLDRGVTILNNDKPVSFSKSGNKFIARTQSGRDIEADIIVTGIGIRPSIQLAESAGLKTSRGVIVNELLQTSNSDIYAAGDNAIFPYLVLGKSMRVEHWDNAISQGKQAGRNMAGANEPYGHMPDFFSDMFDISYEAVGEVNSQLKTIPDWEKENEKGVIYYIDGSNLNGVMMCNIPGKIDEARALIRKRVVPEHLHAVISDTRP
jgi:NADPH-dependent 2,4-dienoyl-CoA reductase/sulfur reductase-like enzyme